MNHLSCADGGPGRHGAEHAPVQPAAYRRSILSVYAPFALATNVFARMM